MQLLISGNLYSRNSLIFWSDITAGAIHCSNMDGSGDEVIVNSNLRVVGELVILNVECVKCHVSCCM